MEIQYASERKTIDEQNRLQKICEEMIAEEEKKQTGENAVEDSPPEVHEAKDCGTLDLDDIELLVLLKVWMKEVLDIIGEIGKGTADSNAYCAGCGAIMRIGDILELEVICQHKFEIVIREVNDELGINLSSDWWDKFLQSNKGNEWLDTSVELPH
ncbi:MAG: hypothetical protein ABSC60_01675 [Acidobacteriota bacterium]|jgi:hypothetical protein